VQEAKAWVKERLGGARMVGWETRQAQQQQAQEQEQQQVSN